jgi:DNA uptake protein ComE-like DNA-binding protein
MQNGKRMTAWVTVVLAIALAGFAQASPKPHAAVPPEARIDVNSATLDDLLKAPGMTRTWATRIIRFRPYQTKQDLVDQGVVPGRVYDRIKDYVIAHRNRQ